MLLKRYEKNPIVTPEMVKPSNPGYRVKGVFNPGAVLYGEEIILLLRVAESCEQKKGFARVPVIKMSESGGHPEILEIPLDDPEVRLKDSRGIVYRGVDYLSTLGHIRVARSRDGFNFRVEDSPFLFPSSREESFGVEDARVTYLEGFYYINYTAVSPDGWATALARTKDFKKVERLGIIFCPENKDVSVFPEKIKGRYCALHRPNNMGFGKPSIWYAESPDLLHWGSHRCIVRPRDSYWERVKIGGGAPCVKTPYGWLQIYHGKGEGDIYSLQGLLLDREAPYSVLKRSEEPLLKPETAYEKSGFFSNTVFSNGVVQKKDGTLLIYYGACDNVTCVAQSTVDDIIKAF